jgi:isoamylase
MAAFETESGSAHPLGVAIHQDGVNFSLFSQAATQVVLLLFEHPLDPEPAQVVRLDPVRNKTFHFWHVFVRGCGPGISYAFRIDGPSEPAAGHRFDPNKVLIGPYAQVIQKQLWKRANAVGPEDNLATSMRCTIVDPAPYDWEGDRPLKRPLHESIIYEMHVGGFTRSPSAGVRSPGTFSAVIEKIPYLQALGITAVELLPVCDFDDSDRSVNAAGEVLRDFWGYNTVAFFSPHAGYCVAPDAGTRLTAFRDMVKALHRAGIEVILDVVFNHTGEGDETGPTYSFRGFDNRTFYLLDPKSPERYANYSGVGNTVNANHPVTQKLILDCLRYWVRDMHVDGFRFDLASILARGEDGQPMVRPPVLWNIELDDVLADSKLIVEAWDASGLYQVGRFPGDRWTEWNGQYRDDVRRFVKGDPGLTGALAMRLAGSADLYQPNRQSPENSINYVTAHDGFTLNDLVSYNQKHNEANGEGNRDGADENFSWNCGVEGPAAGRAVKALRLRQIKNMFTILMLSRGVPMMLGGDEIRRTQHGNNNAYNQDNPTSWFDWTMVESNREILGFFQKMIAFRKAHPALRRPYFYRGDTNDRGLIDIVWHGTELHRPGFADPDARALACTIAGFDGDADLHVMMNMFWEPLTFEVPVNRQRRWRVVLDTSTRDIGDPEETADIGGRCRTIADRSIVVLASTIV